MPKFEVGEIALMVGGHADGAVCEITEIYLDTVIPKDYRVIIQGFPTINKKGWGCLESSLRKKKPPEEEIDWVERLNLVMPNKEKETA